MAQKNEIKLQNPNETRTIHLTLTASNRGQENVLKFNHTQHCPSLPNDLVKGSKFSNRQHLMPYNKNQYNEYKIEPRRAYSVQDIQLKFQAIPGGLKIKPAPEFRCSNFKKPLCKPVQTPYDEQGRLRHNGADICDCGDMQCPGCWWLCDQCRSRKCGLSCRCNREVVPDNLVRDIINKKEEF